VVGQPVKVLVMAGAVNGLILPFALAIILLAANNKNIVGIYKHKVWLSAAGWIVVISMGYMGVKAIVSLIGQ
jgi:Mn2+/Fe2+ NRAMP family transporter